MPMLYNGHLELHFLIALYLSIQKHKLGYLAHATWILPRMLIFFQMSYISEKCEKKILC